jgi:Lipocalin-like domain
MSRSEFTASATHYSLRLQTALEGIMSKLFFAIVLAATLAGVAGAEAQNAPKQLVGTWQVKSFAVRFVDNNETVRPFGDRVSGYIQYAPGGHMVVFLVGGERKPPAGPVITDSERASLYNGIFGAYAGTYSIDGSKVIHRVVASWNEAFTGTDQVRYFKLDGKQLTIDTAPFVNPRYGKQSIATLTFERLE